MLNDAKVHFSVLLNGFVLIVGNVFPGAMVEVVESPHAHPTKTVLGGLVELQYECCVSLIPNLMYDAVWLRLD